MDHVFNLVWDHTQQQWQAAQGRDVSARQKHCRTTRHAAMHMVSMVLTAGLMGHAWAQLPTGGSVASGSGSIAVNGNTMTINQATPRLVTNWQSFSVGAGKTVEFVQPSASAVALNRVLGADVSTIQGSIRANGQVFLLNPNGVLFTPTAQVNVGALVASTLNLSDQDFLAGKYTFEGTSPNAVINQGSLRAAQGGTVALVAARIINEPGASIVADGGQALLGAGSKVTLDLGGPVRIKVEQGALQALIDQGGAIQADGGRIYLTAQSADALARTVINHTGVTRAQTVATGEKGEIYLLGGMEKDRIGVNGTLDASAPQGGAGGFIETSASQVNVVDTAAITTKSSNGTAGQWLIDPYDFSVKSSGGNITGAALGALLDNNSVTIQTTTGVDTLTNLYATGGSNGDILITDSITKASGSATTLTLLAHRNILIQGSSQSSPILIQGSTGHSLNLVMSARATGLLPAGHVDIKNAYIKTFGGDVTIGGGNSTAGGYAIAQSLSNDAWAGVKLTDSLIDASSDAGATTSNFSNWSGAHTKFSAGSSSGVGGSVVIRGQGNSTVPTTLDANLGVWLTAGSSIATAGTGAITLNGVGGNGNGPTYGRVASVGVLLEGRAALISQTGNITINGTAGTGYDAYGVGFTEGNGLIKTGGQLLINAADSTPTNKNDNAVLIRDGTMTFDVGSASEIHAPLVGGTSNPGISSVYGFTKMGVGALTLLGDAAAWNVSLPSNTPQAKAVGSFRLFDGDLLLGTGLGTGQALYSFWQPALAKAYNSFEFSIGAIGGAGAAPGTAGKQIRFSANRDYLISQGVYPPDASPEEINRVREVLISRSEQIFRGIAPEGATTQQIEDAAYYRRSRDNMIAEGVIPRGASAEELARAQEVRKALISMGQVPKGASEAEIQAAKKASQQRYDLIKRGITPPTPSMSSPDNRLIRAIAEKQERDAQKARSRLIAEGQLPGNPTAQERAAVQRKRQSLIAKGIAPPGANGLEKLAAFFNKRK